MANRLQPPVRNVQPMKTLELPQPYLLFLGDATQEPFAKTAFGLRDWARERCVGEYALAAATITTGLLRLSPREAFTKGARALVIGAAPVGGALSASWIPALSEALEAGLDLVSGMHALLSETPELALIAKRLGRRLIDVRVPPQNCPVATGRRRSGKRLLTVGTDCAVGKKYTALAITRGFKALGVDAHFRATGQTGIMLAGAGIPIDAVVSDFVAGAAELLSPDAADDHWDVVEGQGSLFHPSYAGVSVGLLHGTQPNVIIMCHEIGRREIIGVEGFALPDLREAIDLNLRLARLTNPWVVCAGVSLNTSSVADQDVEATLAQHSAQLGLPVADPVRGGAAFERLLDACLGCSPATTSRGPSH
jgi:uncharacterized NAD-dependent epimerase/dehydratase family protein